MAKRTSLLTPFETWPISQFSDEVLDRLKIAMCIHTTSEEENYNVIDMSRFSSSTKLLRVTARAIAIFRAKSIKAAGGLPTPKQICEGEMYLIRVEQGKLQPDWKKAYQRLGPRMDKKIIYVGERIACWFKENSNQHKLILMPSQSCLIKLYVQHLHNIDHSGVECTLAKIQS